jgi:hypothetical protein
MTTAISTRVPLHSSTLAAAAYDPILGKLELDFCDGARYEYSEVGPEIYRGLIGAISKGWYFNQHIRRHFSYVRMPAEN